MLYETYVRDCMRRIEEADEETRRGLVLKLLTGLKQICNHPAHFLKQTNPKLAGRSEKLDLLDELIGTVLAEDGAVLLFTQYVAMARLLEQHLTKAGVAHQFLHGGTTVAERERMVARFQDGGVPVFLLSLKAGGTGLNLTRADHVIHVDRWWNPAVEDQATDRAYRIGQTKPVQVHRFITEGTIEEKIAELLTRKKSLADSVLSAGETALTELSNDDLRDLVTLRKPADAGAAMTELAGGVTHPRFAAAAGRRRRAPGGARRSCARSRRRPSPRPSSSAGARSRAAATSARSRSPPERFVAAVIDRGDAYTVTGSVPVLAADDQSVLVELIAAGLGPHRRAHVGRPAPPVRRGRRGGRASSSCRTAVSWARPAPCETWLDPCPHALAVLTQVAWLIQRDPFVLFQLRGLARDEVLARLHALSSRVRSMAARRSPPTARTASTTESMTWLSPRRPPCVRRATSSSCWLTRPLGWPPWWRPGGRRAPRRGAAGRDRRP